VELIFLDPLKKVCTASWPTSLTSTGPAARAKALRIVAAFVKRNPVERFKAT
jgi:hypothetical protein